MKIYEEFEVSAAHHLPNYDGKCANLHGHNYKVEVWIEGKAGKNGMLVDFSELKEIVMKLDHSNLNNYMDNPTAENMVEYYLNNINLLTGDRVEKIKVRIWEDRDSYAEDSYER